MQVFFNGHRVFDEDQKNALIAQADQLASNIETYLLDLNRITGESVENLRDLIEQP